MYKRQKSSSSLHSTGLGIGVTGLPPTISGLRKSINQPNASSPLAKWTVQPQSDDSDKSSNESQPASPERMADHREMTEVQGRDRSLSTTSTALESTIGSFGSSGLTSMPYNVSPGYLLQRRDRSKSSTSTGVKTHDSSASSGSSVRLSPRMTSKRISPSPMDQAAHMSHHRSSSDATEGSQTYRERSDSGSSQGLENISPTSTFRRAALAEQRRKWTHSEVKEQGEVLPPIGAGSGIST